MRAAPFAIALLVLQLCALGACAKHVGGREPLRIWIDEFFFASGETVLLREAAAATGGAATVAGSTHNRVMQLKSYQLADKVDIMWTGQRGCYEAFKRRLNDTHAVSCVPGTRAVTGKATLGTTLYAAYGDAAWGIVPRSFRLPQQYAELAAHLKQEQGSGQGSLWVLKEDVHRGKGVGVMRPPQVLARALDAPPRGKGFRHVLAQRFLGQQYLVAGRPFYIRLWAVMMGADPARAYIFDGGVAVFGRLQKEGQAADSLIVNLWTQDRQAAAPWSLAQLEQHLEAERGAEAPRRLRRQLHAAVSATLAAALPSVRYAAGRLGGYQGGSFEVLGVDFLLDASLRPWLVEVNQLPSMARKVVACAANGTVGGAAGSTCDRDVPFDQEKERFMHAMLQLLLERRWQHAGLQREAQRMLQAASDAAREGQAPPCVNQAQLRQLLAMQSEQAAAERLGFVPLTAQLYRSLECMTAQPEGAFGARAACGVLAELAPPDAAPSQQVCTVPAGAASRLAGRLRSWGAQLHLEAASLMPRLRHRVARQGAKHSHAAAYQLRPSDERLLAWMQQGSPLLDSPEALERFCNAQPMQ